MMELFEWRARLNYDTFPGGIRGTTAKRFSSMSNNCDSWYGPTCLNIVGYHSNYQYMRLLSRNDIRTRISRLYGLGQLLVSCYSR